MTLTIITALKLLALMLAANGAPVLAKRLLGDRLAQPLDCGCRFIDGQPLLGPSKTLRGFISGIVCSVLAALLLGYSWSVGAIFGLASLAGDALSSFIKRRLRIRSSGRALGLDQIPESALPLWVLHDTLGINALDVLVLVALFFVGALLLSRLMYQLGVRDEPH